MEHQEAKSGAGAVPESKFTTRSNPASAADAGGKNKADESMRTRESKRDEEAPDQLSEQLKNQITADHAPG